MNNRSQEVIRVIELLNSPFAVSTEEGENLFKIIDEYFRNDNLVLIDFIKIELIVSTFLNASIGQLYSLYTTEFIQQHLSVINMTNEDLEILKLVTDRAKEYFKDKNGFERAFKKNFPDATEE